MIPAVFASKPIFVTLSQAGGGDMLRMTNGRRCFAPCRRIEPGAYLRLILSPPLTIMHASLVPPRTATVPRKTPEPALENDPPPRASPLSLGTVPNRTAPRLRPEPNPGPRRGGPPALLGLRDVKEATRPTPPARGPPNSGQRPATVAPPPQLRRDPYSIGSPLGVFRVSGTPPGQSEFYASCKTGISPAESVR